MAVLDNPVSKPSCHISHQQPNDYPHGHIAGVVDEKVKPGKGDAQGNGEEPPSQLVLIETKIRPGSGKGGGSMPRGKGCSHGRRDKDWIIVGEIGPGSVKKWL